METMQRAVQSALNGKLQLQSATGKSNSNNNNNNKIRRPPVGRLSNYFNPVLRYGHILVGAQTINKFSVKQKQ